MKPDADYSVILDRRPVYPERLAVGVPRGFNAQLRARADAEGVTVAALGRQALERLLADPPKPKAA